MTYIFFILLKCLPPSNFVLKKIFNRLNAFFLPINLLPNVMIFALLCNRDNWVFLTLKHKAAHIFLILFAVMDIPMPEPHTRIPKLPFVIDTFFVSFFAKIG